MLKTNEDTPTIITDEEWRNDYLVKNGIAYHKNNDYDKIFAVIKSFYILEPHDGIYERWLVDQFGQILCTSTVFNEFYIADYRTHTPSDNGKVPDLFTEVKIHIHNKSEHPSALLHNTRYSFISGQLRETITKVISKCRRVVKALDPKDIVVIINENIDDSFIIIDEQERITFSELDKWMLNYYKVLTNRCQSIKKEWKL